MPKTIRNEFYKCLTYEKLLKAHNLSQKGKTSKNEIILFNMKKEENLNWLCEALKAGTYEHGPYRTFYVNIPRKRKIESARYIDRIVHRWVVDNFLDKYFMSEFIYTSYAFVKDKSVKIAVLDVQKAMKCCKKNWDNYYILKMDILQLFENIDRKILLTILERKVKDSKLSDLINKIIYSTDGEKGLPKGNYISQVFANIYLNEVDQYVKHTLKCKYYFRYMDDSIVITRTKKEAVEILEEITEFLEKRLELFLNSKTQIMKDAQGVNFCGYNIKEDRIKIKDRDKKSLKLKIKSLEKKIKEGEISSRDAYKYVAGYMGYIKVADVKKLTEKLFYCGKL